MTLGTRYFGIDLRTMTDAQGVKVAWWCIWYPRSRTRLGYLYGSVRNALPEPITSQSMPDPDAVDLSEFTY